MNDEWYHADGQPPYGLGELVTRLPQGVTREEVLDARNHYFAQYRSSVRIKEAKSFMASIGPHQSGDPLPPISSPTDVIREMATLAVLALAIPTVGNASAQDKEVTGLFLGPLLWDALPFFWTTDVWLAVEDMAKDIPSHVVSDFELGGESAYWCLEHAETVTCDLDGWSGVTEMKGILLSKQGATLTWNLVGHPHPDSAGFNLSEPELVVVGGAIPPGSKFPDDYTPGALPWVSTILAALAFLESPYIPKSVRRMDRGTRKRFMAAGEPFQDVTYVDLRPVSRRESEASDSLGNTSRDYRCRWIVRGHWREQWYPSLGCHKLKYIPPYIKGPEDKPLKQTVYRVVR